MNKQLSKKINELYKENKNQHFIEHTERRGRWLMIILSVIISITIFGALMYALLLSLNFF